MKLDILIQKLLPKDDRFFGLLEESSQNLLKATTELNRFLHAKTGKQRAEILDGIREIEHQGDGITHRIFSQLNATFVTPMDREDLHKIASALDDILDYIDGSALRFKLYKVKKAPVPMFQLAEILARSVDELNRGVKLLRHIGRHAEFQQVFKKVNEYENEADRVFEEAVAALFEKERDPIEIIKLKEVYVGLETATDKCEDVANVLEGIVIKNA